MTKILIADDNTENLYLLETVLKSHGYEVVSARNGSEAIVLALDHLPDIIVTDILMPSMDGFELCRRCKAHELLNEIPLIFYTATYTDLKDEQFALSLGADRFVIKPQQPEVLIEIVQETLAKPRKAKQVVHKQAPGNETKELQQYNEVLFRKLEKKVLQLEDVIEKQKGTENELRDSEQKYRTLITQSPDGVFVVNLRGIFLAVNRVMCENLKYSEEELLSMNIWDIVPEEYMDLHKKRIADILIGKAPNKAAEYLVRGKDGNLHYVEILSAPYYEGKKLIGFQGIARDITERKKAEKALKASEAQYRLLAEHTTDTIRLMDINLKTTYLSPSTEKQRGFTHQEILEMPLEKQLTPESFRAAVGIFSKEIPRVKADPDYNPIHILDLEYYCKDGTTVWAESKFSLIRDENGKPVSILAEARDITERKQAEEKLGKSYESLKKTLNDAINTMVKIVEIRDPYTAGHQQKVADLATAIAGEMKLEYTRIDNLRMAAVVHDIGKMYVPADILSRPGKLTEIEFSLIKTHAQGGHDIVKGMDFPSVIAQTVLQHHERLDGSGYPRQLKGGDTLLEARILAVADVVEAMASHRPYRPALGIDKALEEISKNRGRLYDPVVADACAKLFTEKGFKFTEY
jgi:PAS domain S-box-containing protein/putative nucleotidyltransferase with HDIG domain